jgi:NOL1/NOP2/fmu family ribosome biogenesis protein
MDAASKKEKDIIAPWLQHTDSVFLKEHFIYALPETLVESYSVVKKALNVQYAGVAIGEIMKERLVPDHALALSHLTSDLTAATELDMETAIRYLQKADIGLSTTTNGWQLVNFQSYNLGWINALANRVNNYYPKELRILKQQDHSASRK